MIILTPVVIAFELLLTLSGAPPIVAPKSYPTEDACKADGAANGANYLKAQGVAGEPAFAVVCNPVMGEQ